MQPHKVCAVIVTYNGIKWIEKCLDSISNSSIVADIVVIDNGSTDGTLDHLRNKDQIKFLHESDHNLGFGKANNIGIRYGYEHGYDFYLLLNQDAWVDQNTIESLVEAIGENPEFGIVSPMHFNGNGSDYDHLFKSYLSRTSSYQEDLQSNTIDKVLYVSPFINAACWLISKTTIEKTGLFHPLFDHYGEDDNYLDRLHHVGFKLGLNPKVKMNHDRGDEENPLKNSSARLYKRNFLRYLLHPNHTGSKYDDIKEAGKLAKKLSKKLSGLSNFSFRLKCFIQAFSIRREVKNFIKERQSELHIN